MKSGQSLLKIDYHAQPVTTAAWSPDGQCFVTGSLHGDHRLCLWSISGHPIHKWDTRFRVQDCAITPDGRRLVAISSERQIIVYNFETWEEEYCIIVKSRMTCINVSRDSRHMLVNMADGEIHLIDIDTAEIVQRFLGQQQGEFVIRSTFGGADQNLIISGSEGNVEWFGVRWNILTELQQTQEYTSGTRRMVLLSKRSRAIKPRGVSMLLRGTRQTHACSLLEEMIEGSGCKIPPTRSEVGPWITVAIC